MTAKQLGDQCAFPTGREGDPGLTVRQEFARSAMQGILADPSEEWIDESPQIVARTAVLCADALLVELAKEQTSRQF